ncbi:YwmB family TATA-box binding protein [Halobacillus sp. Marseille-Q1614]|uniref:YwmB family TATA-box binding protein n=1 Tax=Halobacillus sp. Marseille-Q1614 TaxID=2709134 RepID=UPI0015713F1F|nr:YwmB family TATA-box binding protein [Halobacillus sp. Marseille-Q1614]
MKFFWICSIVAVVLGVGVHPQGKAEGWSEVSPLIEMAAFAEDEQLEISELNITLKETMNIKDLAAVKLAITQYFDSVNVTEENSTEASKLIFTDGQKRNAEFETFTVIVPKNEINSFEVVYTVTSRGTAPLAAQIMEHMAGRVKAHVFTENVSLYSFVKAEQSGKINESLFYQSFKKSFDIATVEETIEESWTSRSGYTTRWGEAIDLPGGPMNVQLGIRNLGNRTIVTIGTPILTAEY